MFRINLKRTFGAQNMPFSFILCLTNKDKDLRSTQPWRKVMKKRTAKPVKSTIHKLRLIVGCTLIGSVVAGAILGWVDAPAVDPRALGAGLGALAGVLTTFHLA